MLRDRFSGNLRILHVVRHPLGCISSAQTHTEHAWSYVSARLPGLNLWPLVERCMGYWLYWNRIAEELAQRTIRVEAIPDEFVSFCEFFGAKPNRSALRAVSRQTNTRAGRYRLLTWADLEAANAPMCHEIHGQAERYGY